MTRLCEFNKNMKGMNDAVDFQLEKQQFIPAKMAEIVEMFESGYLIFPKLGILPEEWFPTDNGLPPIDVQKS